MTAMLDITDTPQAAADTLRALAAQAGTPCDSCARVAGSGWESVPSSLDRERL